MLHPVGELPAAVYWRRRLMVLTLLLALGGGGGWLGRTLVTRQADSGAVTAASSAPRTAPATPALERVVPSLASVRIPTVTTPAVAAPVAPVATTATAAGGPCSDAMLSLQVRAPASAAIGTTPTFDLVVTNTTTAPCVRPLDRTLQEIVLVDAAGNRVWGSNDCFPGSSSDSRTLAPGEAVSFPVVWRGLSSEPTCTAPRAAPAAGAYVLRGRLDTLVSPDVPLTLT